MDDFHDLSWWRNLHHGQGLHLALKLSIHPWIIHPSIHQPRISPPFHSTIHLLSICFMSIYTSIIFITVFINPSIISSICPSGLNSFVHTVFIYLTNRIHPLLLCHFAYPSSLHAFNHSFMISSILCHSICPFTTNALVFPSTHPFCIHLSIYWSVHSCIYPSLCPVIINLACIQKFVNHSILYLSINTVSEYPFNQSVP